MPDIVHEEPKHARQYWRKSAVEDAMRLLENQIPDMNTSEMLGHLKHLQNQMYTCLESGNSSNAKEISKRLLSVAIRLAATCLHKEVSSGG